MVYAVDPEAQTRLWPGAEAHPAKLFGVLVDQIASHIEVARDFTGIHPPGPRNCIYEPLCNQFGEALRQCVDLTSRQRDSM